MCLCYQLLNLREEVKKVNLTLSYKNHEGIIAVCQVNAALFSFKSFILKRYIETDMSFIRPANKYVDYIAL